MKTNIACPNCSSLLRVSREKDGQRAKCPNCKKPFVISFGEQAALEIAPVWKSSNEQDKAKASDAAGDLPESQKPAFAFLVNRIAVPAWLLYSSCAIFLLLAITIILNRNSTSLLPENINERVSVLEEHGFVFNEQGLDYVQYKYSESPDRTVWVELDTDDDGIHLTLWDKSATTATENMVSTIVDIYEILGVQIRDLTVSVSEHHCHEVRRRACLLGGD